MSEERFIARWARLKAARVRTTEAPSEPARPPVPATTPEAEPVATLPASPPDNKTGGEATVDPASLPPIESLTAQSDFKAFLQQGVPEEMRRAALRRLWRSDPTLAAPEVLDLHNLDYTLPAVPEAVRTAYKVGKGFLDAIEEGGQEPAGERPPEPGTPTATADEEAKDPPTAKS